MVMLPSLKDLLDVFDRWGEWKRIRQAPQRLDELEKRLAALEAKGRPSANTCDACGNGTMKRASRVPDPVMGAVGLFRETWKCQTCGETLEKQTK